MSKQNTDKGAEKEIVPIPELVEAAEKPKVKYVSEDEAAKLVGMAGSKESRAMDAETAELEAQLKQMKEQMEAKIKSSKDASVARKEEVSAFTIEMRKLPVDVSTEIKEIIDEDDKLHDEVTKFAKIRLAKEAEFRKFNELRASQEAEFRKANGVLNTLKKEMKDRMIHYNIPENVANEVLRTKTAEIPTEPSAKAAPTGTKSPPTKARRDSDGKILSWSAAANDLNLERPDVSHNARLLLIKYGVTEGYTPVLARDTNEEIAWEDLPGWK